MDQPELDPEIDRYYSQEWDEDARIRSGLNELEFIRTQEIVRRFLPDGPLHILDVGGGGGVHSEWLLGDGHTLTLIDPVERHVADAGARLGHNDSFAVELGDGRSLPHPDGSFDVVLLFGPLYHLTKRADRIRVWQEGVRVLRSGGLVYAAAITRFASLVSGMSEGVIFDDEFRALVTQDLEDGQHRNPADRDFFTTAFFHHPDELREEAVEVGRTSGNARSSSTPPGRSRPNQPSSAWAPICCWSAERASRSAGSLSR
jgi:SAM-dependent methyltransferase